MEICFLRVLIINIMKANQEMVIGSINHNVLKFDQQLLPSNHFRYHIALQPVYGSQITLKVIENNEYIIMIPAITLNISCFVEVPETRFMMYFCKSMIIQLDQNLKQQIGQIFAAYKIEGKWIKGQNYYKFKVYECMCICYKDLQKLDQLRNSSSLQKLIKYKIKNTYQYCIQYFGDFLMADLLTHQIEQIQQQFQNVISQIQQIYNQLACKIPKNISNKIGDYSFKSLKKQLTARIFDQLSIYKTQKQECLHMEFQDQLIDQSMQSIMNQIYNNYQQNLCKQLQQIKKIQEGKIILQQIYEGFIKDLSKTLKIDSKIYKVLEFMTGKILQLNFKSIQSKSEYGYSKKLHKMGKVLCEKQKQCKAQKQKAIKTIYQKAVQIQKLKKQLLSVQSKYSEEMQKLNEQIKQVKTSKIALKQINQRNQNDKKLANSISKTYLKTSNTRNSKNNENEYKAKQIEKKQQDSINSSRYTARKSLPTNIMTNSLKSCQNGEKQLFLIQQQKNEGRTNQKKLLRKQPIKNCHRYMKTHTEVSELKKRNFK